MGPGSHSPAGKVDDTFWVSAAAQLVGTDGGTNITGEAWFFANQDLPIGTGLFEKPDSIAGTHAGSLYSIANPAGNALVAKLNKSSQGVRHVVGVSWMTKADRKASKQYGKTQIDVNTVEDIP